MTEEKQKLILKTKEIIDATMEQIKPLIEGKPFKLDMGSGAHYQQPLEDWVHLDACKDTHTEIVCEFSDVPLPNDVVDLIYMGDAIEHIPLWEHDKVMREINRMLKIGGEFTGRTPNADWVMKAYASDRMTLHDAMLNLYGWADSRFQLHYQTFTKETLQALLERYGFDQVDFSGSPGIPDYWWLVFSAKKCKSV